MSMQVKMWTIKLWRNKANELFLSDGMLKRIIWDILLNEIIAAIWFDLQIAFQQLNNHLKNTILK